MDALVWIPLRNHNRNTALFKLGCAGWDRAVWIECGNRKFVAFLCGYWSDELLEIFVLCDLEWCSTCCGGCPALWVLDFFEACDCIVYASEVHCDDCIAFLAVCKFDLFFHILFCIFIRNDVCKFEESCLHDGVDAFLCAEFRDDLETVESVELDMFFCNHVLH